MEKERQEGHSRYLLPDPRIARHRLASAIFLDVSAVYTLTGTPLTSTAAVRTGGGGGEMRGSSSSHDGRRGYGPAVGCADIGRHCCCR